MNMENKTDIGEFDTKFKFGDIVENHWASERNPHRKGIVISVGKYLHLTDGKGKFWDLVKDKDSQTKIIGSILGTQSIVPATDWLIDKSKNKPVGEKYSFYEVVELLTEFSSINLGIMKVRTEIKK